MVRLTDSQQKAVLFFDNDSAILAGAGSGKTLVLVEKVAALIEKLHVPPSRILVVTFTEKAADEMKGRLAKRLRLRKEDLDALPIGTIHGAAADLLRRFGRPLGLDPTFKIMNEFLAGLERLRAVRGTFLELIEARHPEALEAVGHLGLKGSLRFFSRILDRGKDSRVPYAAVLDRILASYRERKAALGMLDFDDLELYLLRLSPPDLYDWILVDEFQDTSPIQWKILSRLHVAGKNRLVIVGDPRQSIYRFRRADPSLFHSVSREILQRGGRLFPLNENFRSASEVIEFVNLVSEPLFEEAFPPLVATRKDLVGGIDRLTIAQEGYARDIRTAEARAVLDHLSRLRGNGLLWRSMALLFRTRHAVAFYEGVLKELKIPYRTSMGESLLERPEIIAATTLLKRLAGPSEAERPLIEATLSHTPLVRFSSDLSPMPLPSFIEGLFEKIVPLFPQAVHRNLYAFKSLILDLICLDITGLEVLLENLSALRQEEARIPCPSAEEESSGEVDAVSLMTVHAAKGLEFPVVVLCDLAAKGRSSAKAREPYVESANGDVVLKEKDKDANGLKDRLVKGDGYADLERREKEAEHEESKRLLYVALTRAKERIVLPLPSQPLPSQSLEKKPRKGQSESWSDWLQL